MHKCEVPQSCKLSHRYHGGGVHNELQRWSGFTDLISTVMDQVVICVVLGKCAPDGKVTPGSNGTIIQRYQFMYFQLKRWYRPISGLRMFSNLSLDVKFTYVIVMISSNQRNINWSDNSISSGLILNTNTALRCLLWEDGVHQWPILSRCKQISFICIHYHDGCCNTGRYCRGNLCKQQTLIS